MSPVGRAHPTAGTHSGGRHPHRPHRSAFAATSLTNRGLTARTLVGQVLMSDFRHALRRLRPKSPGASVKPAEFVDYRARCRAFESLAATMPGPGSVTLTGGGEPERLRVLPVTANFFETVGVSPSLGRTFRPEEERVPAP